MQLFGGFYFGKRIGEIWKNFRFLGGDGRIGEILHYLQIYGRIEVDRVKFIINPYNVLKRIIGTDEYDKNRNTLYVDCFIKTAIGLAINRRCIILERFEKNVHGKSSYVLCRKKF